MNVDNKTFSNCENFYFAPVLATAEQNRVASEFTIDTTVMNLMAKYDISTLDINNPYY